MNRRTLVRVTIALAIGALITIPSAVALAGPGTFDVRAFGATGNGSTLDDDAIDAAINVAAADGGGGTVVFPAGTYLSRTIHLKSNITLQLDSGSTILAASSGMDAAEPNSFDQFQDYGHSHFHNALMWGDGIANFAILMNGCHDVTIDNLKVLTSTDRDAINIINTSNVDLNNSRVEGRDDAVVLKSDFALGQTFVSQNIRVHDSTILSTQNNAIQFGSETCGDFRDVHWDRLTLLGGGKAGIGMVSMDGATIENVTYTDITMTRAAAPIFIKIGSRGRCPGS